MIETGAGIICSADFRRNASGFAWTFILKTVRKNSSIAISAKKIYNRNKFKVAELL